MRIEKEGKTKGGRMVGRKVRDLRGNGHAKVTHFEAD